MKKLLLVTLISVLGFTNVNAQDIQFGAKAGLNFASVVGDYSDDFDTVTAFNFGVMAEIPISSTFSFQPELIFSGQGYSIGDDVVALNYLNVPLMAKYYVTQGFSVQAGPQVGFLLNVNDDDLGIEDSFNTVDFGINLGLGYKLKNGLNFDARYNIGLTNINEIDSINNKNGVFQVSVGYFFF
ncbi:porin family protein [Formosa sp. PL04]|uniref:porin family protein n=1 Tax=Formosa sp. PL04 TaxID=3081755 RepID=UPI0029829F4E|nr:porin family protein [Formosa sp. PL04]MDW5288306.1 porin family protein [Formosa sp. PL04]